VVRPEKHIPASLEEAVAELNRDPPRTVHARVDELEVEIRVVEKPAHPGGGLPIVSVVEFSMAAFFSPECVLTRRIVCGPGAGGRLISSERHGRWPDGTAER
jgi:hypothetical protein